MNKDDTSYDSRIKETISKLVNITGDNFKKPMIDVLTANDDHIHLAEKMAVLKDSSNLIDKIRQNVKIMDSKIQELKQRTIQLRSYCNVKCNNEHQKTFHQFHQPLKCR